MPPAIKQNLFSVEHLSYVYSMGTALEKQALKDVSFEMASGEFVAVIGHTGSGKSTLIRHLNGLFTPTAGVVRFCGEDINQKGYPLQSLRRHVGMVFQYSEYQLFEADVLSDVAFGPKNLGCSDADARARAKEALNLVGLDKRLYDSNPFELSGGQKRLAAIAGVLAMDPKVLVLDEPAAGLDDKAKTDFLERLGALHKQKGLSVLFVSHNMEDAVAYADRILVLAEGSLAMQGTPHEVFSRRRELEMLGLAAPEMVYLMDDLKTAGFDVRGSAISVEEALVEITRIFGASPKEIRPCP